jgi:hypothetical protein
VYIELVVEVLPCYLFYLGSELILSGYMGLAWGGTEWARGDGEAQTSTSRTN